MLTVSRVWLFCDPVDCSMPGFPVRHQLPELTQTHPSTWWCHSTISSCPPLNLPSIFPSIRWPKHWNFTISPSNEYSGLICLISLQSNRLLSLFRHLSSAQTLQFSATTSLDPLQKTFFSLRKDSLLDMCHHRVTGMFWYSGSSS